MIKGSFYNLVTLIHYFTFDIYAWSDINGLTFSHQLTNSYINLH